LKNPLFMQHDNEKIVEETDDIKSFLLNNFKRGEYINSLFSLLKYWLENIRTYAWLENFVDFLKEFIDELILNTKSLLTRLNGVI
jgi:hypothetical protein